MPQDSGVSSLFTVTLIQVVVGALLFIALLNGQRELAVLALLVLVIAVGARLWARASLSGMRYHLSLDRQQVFPGESVTAVVRAQNAKLLPIWVQALVPAGALLRQTGETLLHDSTLLLWYQATEFRWALAATRRGVYPIGPLYMVTGDLFSFFSRRVRTSDQYALIVYPALVPLQPLSIARRDFFGVPGPASPVQDPIYILGTRDYQHGQPSKYIHWKASARHNRLQEKVFESTVQEKVLLVVDVDSFARAEAADDPDAAAGFEESLQVVASLAVEFDARGSSVGFIADGILTGGGLAGVPVARNDHQPAAILESLARLEMKSERDLKDLLGRRLADAWGVSCVYFAYDETARVAAASGYLRQRRTPAVFVVCRRGGSAPVEGKVYTLDNLRAGGAR